MKETLEEKIILLIKGIGTRTYLKDGRIPTPEEIALTIASRLRVDEEKVRDTIQLRYFKLMYPNMSESDGQIVANTLTTALTQAKGIITIGGEDED